MGDIEDESPIIVLRHIALLTVAVTSVAAAVTGVDEPADALPAGETIELACGGYDADGNVVSEAAVELGGIEVAANDPVEVPAVCGGYTADGTFIGDD
ncbi:MAG: hypothetical protein R3343_01375 [Nitriliruptorales bacterium]|nr:hypothetical protein [Nitriliruptorales bacterium]